MRVYIKGITTPKRCSECQFFWGDYMDGLCHAANKWLDDDEHWTWYVYHEGDGDFSKPLNCPLIPVPEHGRLIDADAVREEIDSARPGRSYEDAWVLTVLGNAPTIIPADKEIE